jgi:dipeptidyl-peptidase-4
VVANRWGGARNLWLRWLASRGYLAFQLDNQASLYFGKRGEDRLHRRFGELELAGQLAGVAWLRARGDADLARVGLWGWSGGGFNTLYSILHRPGVWRAAVAGAPVTDWRLYDSIWTERYLDLPADNPDGYRDSSPLGVADRLADALLVVHGTGDDNVHPQNSIALMKALVKADMPFEDAIYPDEKHGFKPGAIRHFYRRMTDFFDRHLGAPR